MGTVGSRRSIYGTAIGRPWLFRLEIRTRDPGDMPLQTLLAIFMLGMAGMDLLQAVPHEELVVSGCEDGGGHVDQDGNPGITVEIREGLLTEEDGGHDTRTQIPGQVGGNGVASEAPDHNRVGDANSKWHRDGADKGVCRVQARPDDDADVAVDKEFLEEEISLVGLGGVGKWTEDTGHATVVHRSTMGLDVESLGRLDFRPVAGHQKQSGHESSENLREDVIRDLLPGKALPDGETDSDGRIEMPTTDRRTGYDGKRDTKSKGPTDLEQGSEDCNSNFGRRGARGGKRERSDRGDTGEDVEKDACGFGHHLTHNPRSLVLEIELPLRNWFGWNNMPGNVTLEGVRNTDLDIIGVLPFHIVISKRRYRCLIRRQMLLVV